MGGAVSSVANDFGQNNKPTKTAVLYYANKLTAQAFLDVSQDCSTSVDSSQLVDLECNPDQSLGRQENTFECASCLNNMRTTAESQFILQRETWAKTGDYFVAANIDTQFTEFSEYIKQCNESCKTCNFENTSQMAYVQIDQTCRFSDDMTQEFRAAVEGKFLETLYSKKDIAGSLVSAVGGSNADKTIANVVSVASSRISATFADNLITSLNLAQTIDLTSGVSVVFKGQQQDIVINQTANIVSENKLYDSVLTDSQWQAWANNWQSDTTIDSVGKVLTDTVTSFSSIISSTIGAIMFTLMVLLGVIVIALIVLIVMREQKKI